MNLLQGKLIFVWLMATPIACVLGWWLGRRYRMALQVLMGAPLGAAPAQPSPTTPHFTPATTPSPTPRPPLPTAAGWHRAEVRLIVMLAVLSLAMGMLRGALFHWQVNTHAQSWRQLVVLAIVFSWPLLPAIATLRRWSTSRLLVSLIAWYAASVALVMLISSNDQRLAVVAQGLLWDLLPPAVAFMLLSMRRTRAAAPWLWLPLAIFIFAAIAGIDLLDWLVKTRTPWVAVPLSRLSPWWAMGLFAIAAVALVWWPVKCFARALARAYSKRWVSDLIVHFTAAWALSLGYAALGNSPRALLPLLLIPLALLLWPGIGGPRRAAPTLLVLRVFQQDANVSALFEDVVERWRAVGNTVLIAGTDLVADTLDAADLFDFIDGRLASRFVHHGTELPQRLSTFDWTPDAEGRFRVNECYCHDSVWQAALDALVQRADAVLMDLRGFAAHNAGCRFELGAIARASQLQRVVVLTDASTDLVTARADAAAAPPGRFVWIDLPAGAKRRDAAHRVIAALAGAPSTAAVAHPITPSAA
jgi:hypothetical protein